MKLTAVLDVFSSVNPSLIPVHVDVKTTTFNGASDGDNWLNPTKKAP
jgi:hypothetical protein